MAQDYALFPHLTAAGNVAFGLRAEGLPAKDAASRAGLALERLGIDPARIEFVPVEHHLAHASSAYHLSGYEDAAIRASAG